jgi:hypothetical protein
MPNKHMIVIRDNKLWKQIKIAAVMAGMGSSRWIEQTIREKLIAQSTEINEFLTKDFDNEVKL